MLLAVLLLLMLAAGRAMHLNDMSFVQDEVDAVLWTMGTPTQAVSWHPPDWPPLHALLLWGWTRLVGIHPVVLRIFSLLISLLMAATAFRAGRRIFKTDAAGWMTALVYGALGYSVYLGLYLRAYGMVAVLFPLALYLTEGYFRRPSLRRAIALALTMVVMFYTTYTVIYPFALLGLYTLVVMPHRVWRWWLPGLMALSLAVPEALRRLPEFQVRASGQIRNYEFEAEEWLRIYQQYAGTFYYFWWLVFVVAVLAILWRRKLDRSFVVALFLLNWVLVLPPLTYGLIPITVHFDVRYSWWALLGIALLMGYGLSLLSSRWRLSLAALLLVTMTSIPILSYQTKDPVPPFETNFEWMATVAQPGDVLVIDPNCPFVHCGRPEHWAYYQRAYLDDMVPVVDDPGDHRRVWHIGVQGMYDEPTIEAVRDGRLAGPAIGPYNFFLQLYVAPPNPRGVRFDNGMRFHGVDVLRDGRVLDDRAYIWENDTVTLRLWWSTDEPLEADYSVGTYLHNDFSGDLIVQTDSGPQLTHLAGYLQSELPAGTSGWEPDRLYVEERQMTLPPLINRSESQLYLSVYQWWDSVRFEAPGVTDELLLPIRQLNVLGW